MVLLQQLTPDANEAHTPTASQSLHNKIRDFVQSRYSAEQEVPVPDPAGSTQQTASLSTYDVGVLLIPDEEYDLEAKIFGRLKAVDVNGSKRMQKVGGLSLPTTPAAAQRARDALRRAKVLGSADTTPLEKLRVLAEVGITRGG